MSYEAKQEGFRESRFGTPAGYLTGSEIKHVANYESPDTDQTEVVTSGTQITTKAQYPSSVSPTYTSQHFFGGLSDGLNGVSTTIIGVGGDNFQEIIFGALMSQLNTDGETVYAKISQYFMGLGPSGGSVRSNGLVSISWGTGGHSFSPLAGTPRVTFTNVSPYAYKTAGGVWGTLSDERLKQNIRPISDAIGKLNALNPCHFEFKNSGELLNPEGTRTGFIAQEFEQVLPGHTFDIEPAFDADKAILGEGVKARGLEADLVPYLVKAIQELNTKLEQENLVLKQQLATLSARLDALEAK